MSPFESHLKAALRRREPSPGFAERVLARAARQRPKRRWDALRAVFSVPAYRLACAAALLLLLIAVPYGIHLRQERIKGERAKQEAVLALRIAGGQLDEALQKAGHAVVIRSERSRQ
ncbi:MAG: hypothetical protein KIT09_24850 [Bryobacteraceae bacterium]|nr:hypothetical protein [Bryobacteraceae bacterium]